MGSLVGYRVLLDSHLSMLGDSIIDILFNVIETCGVYREVFHIVTLVINMVDVLSCVTFYFILSM